jgi:CubicO group peptidase (beta-lactamase class C family)
MTRMSSSVPVQGRVAPGFEPVFDVFARLFAEQGEKGASVALVREGQVLVNLQGGQRDRHGAQPWQPDTLACLFSTTKAITALCVQRAIDQRLIEVDREIRHYWPDFGRPDKRQVTLGWVLNHRSGLPAVSTPLPDAALFDWEYMTSMLAAQAPWWTPGSTHGYHMVSWGWLVGEVFRRAVGVTVGQYLREEIAGPLGLDVHIGLDAAGQSRCADMLGPKTEPEDGRLFLYRRVQADRECNGHATALAMASLFDHAVNGDRVISAKARQRCLQVQSEGDDAVVLTRTRFGPGFMLNQPDHPECGFGPSVSAFGHAGSGGSLAFGDPASRIGFAYVMSQMNAYLFVDPRARLLLDTVYACLRRVT